MAREPLPQLSGHERAHSTGHIHNASKTDATPVPTRHQAEMYCCKYRSEHVKGKSQGSVLFD
eukprot:11529002-Karenia_brevis.AAC.1